MLGAMNSRFLVLVVAVLSIVVFVSSSGTFYVYRSLEGVTSKKCCKNSSCIKQTLEACQQTACLCFRVPLTSKLLVNCVICSKFCKSLIARLEASSSGAKTNMETSKKSSIQDDKTMNSIWMSIKDDCNERMQEVAFRRLSSVEIAQYETYHAEALAICKTCTV